MNWDDLVTVWYYYNCLLLNIIENVDETALGNVWVKNENALPLEHLIKDYYKHLELHIEHFNNRWEKITF